MSEAPQVLVIAASDSSGGAGLTRDVATLSALDTEARCALTAVTVQTHAQLRTIHHLPPELVRAQIQAALAIDGLGAVKIGMLGRHATVQAVAESLPPRARIPIVLDPVLVSTSGGTLLDREGQRSLIELLLPRVSLLTPNIPEAASLLGEPMIAAASADRSIDESLARVADVAGVAGVAESSLMEWAQRLLRLGPLAVLLKGGHAHGEHVVDLLAIQGEGMVCIRADRIRAQRRGTGCSLASAIAAHLARGYGLLDACRRAQEFVVQTLRRADSNRVSRL